MKDLYSVMELLLEVDYKQRSVLYFLRELENFYRQDGREEQEMLVSIVKSNIEGIETDLQEGIHNLDKYMIQDKKPR